MEEFFENLRTKRMNQMLWLQNDLLVRPAVLNPRNPREHIERGRQVLALHGERHRLVGASVDDSRTCTMSARAFITRMLSMSLLVYTFGC